MPWPDVGWIEGPNYDDDLASTVGYVTRIWVEQEDSRATIRFRLRIFRGVVGYHDQDCIVMLDQNTTVALAQLQLLRDAFASYQVASEGAPAVLVHVHFNFRDDDHEWLFVYWLRVIYDGELPYPTTAQGYSNHATHEGWWWR